MPNMDLHDIGWEPIVGQVVGNLNKAGFVAGRLSAFDDIKAILLNYRHADINLISSKIWEFCAASRNDLDLVSGVTRESIDRANQWLAMHHKGDSAPAAQEDGDKAAESGI